MDTTIRAIMEKNMEITFKGIIVKNMDIPIIGRRKKKMGTQVSKRCISRVISGSIGTFGFGV